MINICSDVSIGKIMLDNDIISVYDDTEEYYKIICNTCHLNKRQMVELLIKRCVQN